MGREPCSLAEYHAITIHPNIIHTSIYGMAIINERAIASERVLRIVHSTSVVLRIAHSTSVVLRNGLCSSRSTALN